MFLFEIVDPFVKITGASWLADISFATIIIRLVLAILCGGLIGLERAVKQHAAGFRTYIVVCLGATVAMLTNEFLSRATNMGDGARLGAQVISGIGFLGAGTIMFTSRNQVRGLTTAAGLWACACMGLSIGIGFYTLSVIATLVIVGVLAVLPGIENLLTSKARQFAIHVELAEDKHLVDFIDCLRDMNYKILSVEYNQAYLKTGLSVYTIELRILGKRKIDHKAILKEFGQFQYVHYVEEIMTK
ncbi:MAG: MgtC/SapB family protein [Anaeroplasmataceae bacterium]|nr:MgtC/SapB family protein [Anaeroplasmataceae bacterium]